MKRIKQRLAEAEKLLALFDDFIFSYHMGSNKTEDDWNEAKEKVRIYNQRFNKEIKTND